MSSGEDSVTGLTEMPSVAPPGLWALTRAFAWVGVISMGGGRFAFYFNEIVTRRRWLSEDELIEQYGLANLLPGPNIGNWATLLGQRLRGLPGAVLALAATLAPGAALMLLLSAVYFSRGQVPAFTPIFKGIAPAAAGLTIGTSLQIAWKQGRTPVAFALAAATVAAILVFKLPPLLAIGGLGVAASGYFRLRGAAQ